jgi:hypothetical protein
MSEQQTPRQIEILDIFKRFNFHPKVSNSVLKSYCDRMGYEFLSEGEYQDHMYQYYHDERAKVIIPLILQALQKYQYVPDYIGESKKRELREQNDAIEVEIAKICSDNGIQYREIDVMVKNFAGTIGHLIENAATRMNNMCGVVIATVAGEKFGESLVVKDLEKYHDEVASR